MVNRNVVVVAVAAVLILAAVGAILLIPSAKAKEITIVAQVNSEGSAIFLKDGITIDDESADFGGLVLATPGISSIQHMMLMKFAKDNGYNFAHAPADRNNLDSDTIYWIEVSPINMKAALEEGEIDGGIAWEPYCSQIACDDVGWIYKWSSELSPGHPCCVIAVESEFLASNHEAVVRFLAGHILATNWIIETTNDPGSENYTKMVEMASDFAHVSEETVKSSLESVRYAYEMEEEWKAALEEVVATYTELGLFANSLSDIGYNSPASFIDHLVNNTYLNEALERLEGDDITSTSELIDVRVGWLNGDIHQLARLVGMNKTVGEGYGFDGSIFEACGINVISGDGNPYANGGAVMDAFFAGAIDIGYLGSPPAILRTVNGAL